MLKRTRAEEGTSEPLEHEVPIPEEYTVDQNTWKRLDELCREMTNTCGLVESILRLALQKEGDKRTAYIKSALDLSTRAIRAIKMFLSEWAVLVEESKRQRS